MVRGRRTRRGQRLGAAGRTVPGLYSALLERHRGHDRIDPRLMRRVHTDGKYCTSPGVVCDHDPLPVLPNPTLDDLEAGRPVRLEGRELRGLGLPDTRLRRDQAFDWFEVRGDDTVRPMDDPSVD